MRSSTRFFRQTYSALMDGRRRSRTHAPPIYQWAKDTGHLEITGGMGQSDSLASSRRPDVPAGALRGRNGCHGLDRENRVGLREICRVSRREISQAGRDALALARLAFSFLAHPGSRKYGGGSCNPSVMRSYFAPT